jgi:signal transduction histidine kinase
MGWLRRLPLRTKGALAVLLLIAAIFVAVAALVYTTVRHDLVEQLVAENHRMVTDLAASARDPLLTTDLSALQKLLRQLAASRAVEEAIVVGEAGQVVAATRLGLLGAPPPDWARSGAWDATGNADHQAIGWIPPEPAGALYAPVTVGNRELGRVFVRFDQRELRHMVSENLASTLNSLLWLGLFTGLVGTAGSFLLSGFITRPIRRLTGEVETMQHEFGPEGETKAALAETGDELHRLQQGFYHMRDALGRYLVELDRLHQREQALNCMATIGEMSAQVAHELRNSLSSLRGASRYLHRHLGSGNDRYAEFSEIIEEEVQRLYDMTEGFLDFSRPFEPNLETQDLCSLVRETLERVRAEYQPLGTRLEVQCPGSSLAQVDMQLIDQALYNLLTNALDFLDEDDEVTVAVAPSGDSRWELAVTDTGPGIPEAEQERVFQPFVTSKSGGSGLGLAVVAKVALVHGGTARAGTAAGGGARLALDLPRAKEA